MGIELAKGSSNPVETGVSREISDRDAKVVKVEGLYSTLEDVTPSDYCPAGYTVESSTLASNADGFGVLSVRCVKYEEGASFTAERETVRIEMSEVQYDLEDHPHLTAARDTILKWLATDEADRVSSENNGTMTYKYKGAAGTLVEITDATALQFCAAFMAGIKSFTRYYPVVERVGTWKNPPGMTRSNRSFSSGEPTFSDNIGEYDNPPVTLNGYPSGHWFKSKDSWSQNADTTWTRTEQWTYTPEGASGANAWIYNTIND